jgi:rhamnosyltransferase
LNANLRNKLAAVVVTFNPPADFKARIIALAEAVEHIWILDNSPFEIEGKLDCPSQSITQLFNGKNIGVAAALNIGIGLARDHGYKWVISLDQDTSLPVEYYKTALAAIAAAEMDDKVALFAPSYDSSGIVYQAPKGNVCLNDINSFRRISFAITSGSIVRINPHDAVGGMDSRLFIDYVDYDFCIKLKLRGYQLLALPTCIKHSVGNVSKHKFLFWVLTTSNHSAPRLFSAGRNLTVLTQRYYKTRFLLPLIGCWLVEFRRLMRIVGLEQQASRKIRAFANGVVEGVCHKDTRDIGESKYYRNS